MTRIPGGGPLRLLSLCLLALLVPAAAKGQAELYADAGISHSLSPAGAQVGDATYVFGGIRIHGAVDLGERAGYFGRIAGGLSLEETAGDWLSGSAGLWAGRDLGSDFALEAEVRGNAFTVGEPLGYRAVTGQVLPRLEWRSSDRITLLLHAEAGAGRSRVVLSPDLAPPVRGPPFVPTDPDEEETITSDLWHVGGGPGVRAAFPDAVLEVRGAVFESLTGTYRKLSTEVRGEVAGVGWSASLGVWDTPVDTEVAATAGFRVPLGNGWSASGGGGRGGPDPLLASPASGFGGVTVSRMLTRFEREVIPLYRVTEGEDGPAVRFALEAPEAERVELAGDFTGWERVEMRREGDFWTARLDVDPGAYHFGFLVDDEWYVPEDAPGRTSDEWGRQNATLVVLTNGEFASRE